MTHETEITPEMIEAGVSAFYDYDSRFEEARDAVAAIYLAMQKLRQKIVPHWKFRCRRLPFS